MSIHTRDKGSSGEDQAVLYLIKSGLVIISRNYQAYHGEIDCIAQDMDGTLIFIEVKKALSKRYGDPLHWITREKQRKIIRSAKQYLKEHCFVQYSIRFDVITINNGVLDHLKNAFYD